MLRGGGGKAAVGGLLRQLRSLHLPRRWFADKGFTRRDFSDRGFQEEGYISENCFRSTALHRFKEARDFTHAPVFSGFDEDERAYRARLRRARISTTASNAASKEGGEERKLARSPKLAGKLPEAFDLSGRKRKIDNKRKMLMSRAFKDYTGFEYEGSGLDEHTIKEMDRKKKLGRDKLHK
ncbi:uncharacterized protein LOC112341685 [Selaginella moellendorffii]|uniref:uncharacterized protein LOC112341685 n=1 Tax=Selaginella moellendorffii TaxID=88036 RepID=UPI000D1C6038|nr:uncharacterized protein LOC112341685 [Selaginella moellendorffii]|eukprot:XP_024518029.1 uncharacterized protein LOC112341685 [Selaginella moellendorffii]